MGVCVCADKYERKKYPSAPKHHYSYFARLCKPNQREKKNRLPTRLDTLINSDDFSVCILYFMLLLFFFFSYFFISRLFSLVRAHAHI